MKKYFFHILDILFPKKKNIEELEILIKEKGIRSLKIAPQAPHNFIQALFHYKDPTVRTLVWELKYGSNHFIINEISQVLSEEIQSYVEEHGSFLSKQWLVVPIPASKKHLKNKGFNQTEEIVKAIINTSVGSSLIYQPNTLIKIKETEPQASIKNRSKRLKNLIGCFSVPNTVNVLGKNIVLIDDVTTTGSTLKEAERALKQARAKKIIAFTVAH